MHARRDDRVACAHAAWRWTQGAPIRFFSGSENELVALAAKIGEDEALACYNDCLKLRRVAAHPLNARLLLEDTLIRYCRHFRAGKKP